MVGYSGGRWSSHSASLSNNVNFGGFDICFSFKSRKEEPLIKCLENPLAIFSILQFRGHGFTMFFSKQIV